MRRMSSVCVSCVRQHGESEIDIFFILKKKRTYFFTHFMRREYQGISMLLAVDCRHHPIHLTLE